MKAIIIGATGSTGKNLVQELIKDDQYESVRIFVRRPTGILHPKLIEQVIDFSSIEKYQNDITGDVLFSCLGTTIKDAGSKEEQRRIDLEIPLLFATLAKQNNIKSLVLVSAVGASIKSSFFYSRLKGELETALEALQFSQYIIFRPGLLIRKESNRMGEKLMSKVLKFLNSIGLFKRYKPLATEVLAAKLAKAPFKLPLGKFIIELNEIICF